jgi:hypothetical protein
LRLVLNGRIVDAEIQYTPDGHYVILVRDLLVLSLRDLSRLRIHSASDSERALLRSLGYPIDDAEDS